jgi:putative ABC transport system permease protein
LNGADFTVIGVAPESFPGMYIFSRPDFYVPLAMAKTFSTNPEKSFFADRDDRELAVRARLKPAVSLLVARNELAALARNLAREYPKANRDRGAAVHTQFEMRTRGSDLNWKFSVIFTILALAVLLVACTNVAGLLLSRARSRTREIAVRLAIGAGRSRLIRMLLTESLVLALLGGLAGVAVAYAGIHFMASLSIPAELPVRIPFQLDTRVLLATVALSLLSALACGLAPALQSTRTNLVTGLKSSDADDVEGGPRRLRGRSALVVAQIAMSLMLLAAAFLMYRGFHNTLLDRMTIGQDAREHILMTRFDPRLVQYDTEQTRRFYQLLGERARQIPGVRSAAFTQDPPLALDDPGVVSFVPDGFVMPREREAYTSLMDSVDEGYFETLGIPILRGREILATDTADSPRIAVVNEHFARHYWPNGDAVGKRIRLDRASGAPVEIVGVAQTMKYRDTFDRGIDFLYMPFSQHPAARMVLLLRTDGDPLQVLQPVRSVVHGLEANMPMLETRTYADLYRYATVEGPGMAIKLVGTLGTVGLLLAIAGLYGLVAYNVSRRTREIGIRIAIGAKSADVIRLVMGKGLALVAAGTAIGLALGFGLERLMNAMLFNAGGTDFVVYLMLVPAMVLVTMVAAYVPARKATRIPPTLALRCE